MTLICQSQLPADLRGPLILPGVSPLDPASWLHVDDVFAEQMALRETLLAERKPEVLRALPGTQDMQHEALELVLDHLSSRDDFHVGANHVLRPDGVKVTLDAGPLECLTRLVQEDFCILDKAEGQSEHDLLAATLCFPASWRLLEKLGRPMIAIHEPVAGYEGDLARRVQRLMDGVQVGRPLWRFTKGAGDPTLFQPVSLTKGLSEDARAQLPYVRAERQSLVRMPRTRAVLFSIHTYVVRRETA